jgi:hypothetical protein
MGINRDSGTLPAILNLSLIKLNEGLGLSQERKACEVPRVQEATIPRFPR